MQYEKGSLSINKKVLYFSHSIWHWKSTITIEWKHPGKHIVVFYLCCGFSQVLQSWSPEHMQCLTTGVNISGKLELYLWIHKKLLSSQNNCLLLSAAITKLNAKATSLKKLLKTFTETSYLNIGGKVSKHYIKWLKLYRVMLNDVHNSHEIIRELSIHSFVLYIYNLSPCYAHPSYHSK